MHDIAFCGFIGSGKTQISNKLKEKYSGEVRSIATPLKKFAQDILDTLRDGLSLSYQKLKKPEHRNFLVYIGEIMRDPNFGNENFWISKINFTKNNTKYIYIDDVRHPNESTFLKKHGFAIIRLDVNEQNQQERVIKRDGSFDSSIRSHHSEINHLNIKPDIIINTNDKTEDEILSEISRKLTPLLKLRILIRKYYYRYWRV